MLHAEMDIVMTAEPIDKIMNDQDAQCRAEARTLLHYILGHPPSEALILRYIRAQPSGQSCLELPKLAHKFPSLVRLFEAPIKPRTVMQRLLRRRLDLALVLCEVSTQGKSLLWRQESETRSSIIAQFIGSVLFDALTMPIRGLITLVLKLRDAA